MNNISAKATADAIVKASIGAFGGGLVGVYLHGSAAMGCWNAEKSDVDVIIVVDGVPTDDEKLRFLGDIVDINSRATQKGVELSVVRRDVCDPFIYPTPYELHFSPYYAGLFRDDPDGYINRLHGVDRDLAAHFTIINNYGISLWGAPIPDVFGDVAREYYLDSIIFDVENAREDVMKNPLYVVLNLCRVLGYMKDGLILSKRSGGQWGMENLPEKFRPLVEDAVLCYSGEKEMMYTENASAFTEYALDMIEKLRRE